MRIHTKLVSIAAVAAVMVSGLLPASFAQAMTRKEFGDACQQLGGYVVEELAADGSVTNTFCVVNRHLTTECLHTSYGVGPGTKCKVIVIGVTPKQAAAGALRSDLRAPKLR